MFNFTRARIFNSRERFFVASRWSHTAILLARVTRKQLAHEKSLWAIEA